MLELPAKHVQILGGVWGAFQEVNAQVAIFHQWEQLEKSGCIENFRLAAGRSEGFREGWFFADSDAFKWLDAAARIYAHAPSQRLKSLMDEFIELIGAAQTEDGYLFTYNQLLFPEVRWSNLQIEHELYCHGHLIEAAVSHHHATGEDSLLKIGCRAADLLVSQFGKAGPEGTPGHQEIEIALIRLYQCTGTERYLDLASHFIEQRGRQRSYALSLYKQFRSEEKRSAQVNKSKISFMQAHPEHQGKYQLPPGNVSKKPTFSYQRWMLNALTGKYAQQHTPVRKQTIPVGHAVRFGYLQTAVAMLHRLRGDSTLLSVLEQAWEHMVTRRMYVTGGIGSLPSLEGFGRDYELDPEYAYCETCAALANLFWNWEMALITGDAKYSDLFEWQLYNAASVGMGLTGKTYLYNNPLRSHGGVKRREWYKVPCCPSNISRTWAGLGRYIFSFQPGSVWVHQYISCKTHIALEHSVEIIINSDLPDEGTVSLTITPKQPAEFTIHLRIPSWSTGIDLRINNHIEKIPTSNSMSLNKTASGYDPRRAWFLPLQRTWRPGDTIQMQFDMPIIHRTAHPRVRGHAGQVAFSRGPIVYCLESIDNPDVDIFNTPIEADSIRPVLSPMTDLCLPHQGGILTLIGQTISGQKFTAIPYHLWANRGESKMTVWINT